MPVFTKGNFQINLGVFSLAGELSEEDRQCAWELYCELVSRVALVGKVDVSGEQVFVGETYDQSLDSLYSFVGAARALMRRYPVGRLGATAPQNHLGFFIAALLETVVRPFLEKWQAAYRHWWEQACARLPEASPFERQEGYPHLEQMRNDWRELRHFCRAAARELTETFSFPDVTAIEPPELRQRWQEETRSLVEARHG